MEKDAALGARAASLSHIKASANVLIGHDIAWSDVRQVSAKIWLEDSMMTTKHANQKLATAIRDHLLNVDAVPPTAEASRLAGELAQVCLTELKIAGLRIDKVENLFASSADKAKARGAR